MATNLEPILRRARNRLDDDEGALYTDAELREAVLFFLEDVVTPVSGVTYTAAVDSNDDWWLTPALGAGMPRLVSSGVALEALRRESVGAARMAVSMDSPAGRVNLTERAQRLAAMMEALEDEYDDAYGALADFVTLVKYVDTSGMETVRLEDN